MENIAEYKGNFKTEVIEASNTKPVIVDFYADWCGPCKKLAPLLEQHAKAGKFTLVKIDIDEHNDDADAYNVTSIPHVMLFKNGQKVSEFLGNDLASLKSMVDSCN